MDISDEVRNLLRQSEAMRNRWSTSLTTPKHHTPPPQAKATPVEAIASINPSLSSAPTEKSMASTFTSSGPSDASIAAWVHAYSEQMPIPEIRVGSLADTNGDEEEEENQMSSSHSSSSSGRSPQYVDSILTPAPSVLRDVSRSDTVVFSDPSSSSTSRPPTSSSQEQQRKSVLSVSVIDGVLTRQKSPKPVYRDGDTGVGGGFSKSVSNDDTPYPSITISSRPEVLNAYNRGGNAHQQKHTSNASSDPPSRVPIDISAEGEGDSFYDGIADRFVVSYETSLNGSVNNEDIDNAEEVTHSVSQDEVNTVKTNNDTVTLLQKSLTTSESHSLQHVGTLHGHVESSLVTKTKSMTQTCRRAPEIERAEAFDATLAQSLAQEVRGTAPKPVDLLLECRMAVEGVRAQLVARYSSPTHSISSRRGRSGSPGGRRSVGRSTRSKHGDMSLNTEPRHNPSHQRSRTQHQQQESSAAVEYAPTIQRAVPPELLSQRHIEPLASAGSNQVTPPTSPPLQHSSADSSLSMLEKSPNTTFSKPSLDELPSSEPSEGINIGSGGGVGGPTMSEEGGDCSGRHRASPMRRSEEVAANAKQVMNGNRCVPRDDAPISRRGQRRSESPPRRGVEPALPEQPTLVEPIHHPQLLPVAEEQPNPPEMDDDDDFEKDFYLGYDEPTTTITPANDTPAATIATSIRNNNTQGQVEHQPPHISRKKNNAASASEPSSKQQFKGEAVTAINDSLVYHLSSKNASMASPTTIGAIAASAAAEVAAGGGGISGSMGSNDGSFTPFKIEDLLPPLSITTTTLYPSQEDRSLTIVTGVGSAAALEQFGASYALVTSGEQTAPTSPAVPSFRHSYTECTPVSSVPPSPTSLNTEHPSPSFRPSFKQPSYTSIVTEAPTVESPTPPSRSPLVSSPVPSWKVAPRSSFQSVPQATSPPQNPSPPPTTSATTSLPSPPPQPTSGTVVTSDSNKRSGGHSRSPDRNRNTTTSQRRQHAGGLDTDIADDCIEVPIPMGGISELGITPSGAALHPGVRPPRSPGRRQSSDSTSPQRSSRVNTPHFMPEISLPSPTANPRTPPPRPSLSSQQQCVFSKMSNTIPAPNTAVANGASGGGVGGLTAAQVKAAHEKSKTRKEWKRKRLGELYIMQIMVELARLSSTEVSSRLDLCREEEGCRADIGQDMMMMQFR